MSRKAEARIARRLEKELREKEKTVRLREQPSKQVVRSEYAKEEPKAVRAGADPGSIYNLPMSYTVEAADCVGSWESGTPREWGQDVWISTLEPKLQEWQKLNWGEIEQATTSEGRRMHHPMETAILTDEAQYRLIKIGSGSDTIYRFRLGNMKRLWGFRIVSKFEVLWYDPAHEIYPTDSD